ncbi:hypothetical protein [Streptacidiphilus griseoplanus]|uniref:hypothetical protein n=1 Tax=Peterkaempfera griseoplana TaxID=66896 RepID=UPI001FDFCC1A|nr:hypothetical protein [Peterkaempfera griseoplana]
MTSRSAAPGEEPPSLPDDLWEQFNRDTEADIRASAPKEPSARARMVTERLRLEDEAAAKAAKAAKRSKFGRKPKAPALPDGWRTGPAWREMEGGKPRGRKILGLLGVVVAVALVLAALNPQGVRSVLAGHGWGTSASSAPLPPETAAPTAAPSFAATPDTPTLHRPFAGSPAEQYADGADGIVLPAARAVGTRSKAEVAKALRMTKDFLVASNLDPSVLAGATPQKALDLIDPTATGMREVARTYLAHPSDRHDPLTLFSRFDPRQVRVVGSVVKVRGHMTLSKGRYGGARIVADYTFVYPLTRVRQQENAAAEVVRTIARRKVTFELLDPQRYRVTRGTLPLITWESDLGNTACGINDGFFHPQFNTDPEPSPSGSATPSVVPSGPAIDPYDRSKPIGTGRSGTCGSLSRT